MTFKGFRAHAEKKSMGFRVKPVKRLKGPQFKILFEWFDGKLRQSKAITKDDWLKHGFRFDMTVEQAKAHMRVLNAQESLSRSEKRKQKAKAKSDQTRLAQSANLPVEFVVEFEETMLGKSPKVKSYWEKARTIIDELKMPAKDWGFKCDTIYQKFLDKDMSPAYVQKVLPLINRWGMFYSYKLDKPFKSIPAPRGMWQKRLRKAHSRREKGRGNRKSAPLKPVVLYTAKNNLAESEYRWLYMSIWFGLRPLEIDSLNQPSGEFTWKLREINGEKRLYVFQTKNEGDEENEWKYIPCRQPEQLEGLKFIGQSFKRPSRDKMKDYFGETITLYGGRQGFVKLMKFFTPEKENYVEISHWMGHAEIDRTYRSYTKRLEEDYTKDDVYLKPDSKAA